MPSELDLAEFSIFSRQKLIEALNTYNIPVPKSKSRKRVDILSIIEALPDSLIQSLRHHLIAAAGKPTGGSSTCSKRGRNEPDTASHPEHSSKRLCQPKPSVSTPSSSSTECDYPEFLVLPTESEVKQCYHDFLTATSAEALHLSVCIACARERKTRDGQKLALTSVPNRELLKPNPPHFAHQLTSDMLLVSECLETVEDEVGGWFCKDCINSLSSNRLPPLALANRMWIGPIPGEIAELTIPEQILVSLYHPRCYVFKLYPRDTWGHAQDAALLQSGLVGNVTTFEHNLPDIVRMLDGRLMPRPLSILASTIAVTYIGPGRVPKNWLKKTFRVRRAAVYAALCCFKHVTRHPGYQDIEINEEILATLPADDIPVEILAAMSTEPDVEVAQEELDTYLPTDDLDSRGQINAGQRCDTIRATDTTQPIEMESCSLDDSVPDAIPLQYLGAMDTDLSKVSTEEMLLSALVNSASTQNGEGGYAVRHSRHAVSEFPQRPPVISSGNTGASSVPPADKNYSVYAFPCLYPYGEGGIESRRREKVSATEHVRWSLQYHDRRFSTHPTFPYTWFSILQKRQAMVSARVQMRRRDFDRATQLFSSLTQQDLSQAAEEEANGKKISNPAVQSLRRLMHTTGSKVMGSDASRFSYRSQIWSTGLYLNPPSLWITINPSDLHNPIMQVLAGEEIDMDNFQELCGPDAQRRAKNVAQNPYAAAQFFHLFIMLILEKLFGIQSSSRRVNSKMGVLGRVRAYYGVVEAQGRGSLHLHMLVWLHGAPSSDTIVHLLRAEDFRQQVIKYVDATMRAHLDGMTEDTIRAQPREPEIAWSRPPDPKSPNFLVEFSDREQRTARAQQVHTCKRSTCLKYKPSKRAWLCKRRAPFLLSPETIAMSDGTIHPKRTYGYLNTWNPSILVYGACNNDIKFISNGAEARAVIWYITAYQTKKQSQSHNLSALLAETLAYYFNSTDYIEDIRNRNRLLLFRCLHVLNRQMEQSGQQVMSYLLGYGDTFMSHSYEPLYWNAIAGEICRTWPDIKRSIVKKSTLPPNGNNFSLETSNSNGLDSVDSSDSSDSESDSDSDEDQSNKKDVDEIDESENITVERLPNGTLAFRSQIIDYRFRGHALEDYSLLSFVVDTWEDEINKKNNSQPPRSGSRGGPVPHLRSRYLEGHPRAQTKQRALRGINHNTLPNIVGCWLPRNDDPDQYDYYCASILALLKPWRNITDLKIDGQTWAITFGSFLLSASPRQLDLISGAQYYYQCRDAAQAERSRADTGDRDFDANSDGDIELQDAFDETMDVDRRPITEADIEAVQNAKEKGPEAVHGALAVNIACQAGLLPRNPAESWKVEAGEHHQTTHVDIHQVERWREAITADALSRRNADTTKQPEPHSDSGSCVLVADLHSSLDRSLQDNGAVQPAQDTLNTIRHVDVTHLNHDQMRAFKIIRDHLVSNLHGENPPQLLMQIQGEGGTGKSTVIHSISKLFAQHGAADQLVKGAYTGIAASLINGSTLHSLCQMSSFRKEVSKKKLEILHCTWKSIQYFIIDEISMVSRTFFARVSAMVAAAKKNDPVAFGGVNVIICGDFHQFPPVACPEYAALYWPKDRTRDGTEALTGRATYEKFRTVVILKEQCRTSDSVWLDLLQHARLGKCTDEHIKILRSLIVAPNAEGANSIVGEGWKRAVLVTPRHGVRKAWNERANRRHCAETGGQLFTCVAQDTISGRPLSLNERYAAATKKSQRNDDIGQRGCLPEEVEIAVGLQVMITVNIETDLDIANGARGVVQKIILDPRERLDTTPQEVKLQHLPLCVLVKLNRTKAQKLPGLDEGVVPIFPLAKKYALPRSKKGGPARHVTRRQFPITSAYAFTDYRSQGQTIDNVIVDIARPPSGRLTPFHAYVALSRSKGRETIRLLRDFDPDLFQTTPSKRLEEEDRRLFDLDKETL